MFLGLVSGPMFPPVASDTVTDIPVYSLDVQCSSPCCNFKSSYFPPAPPCEVDDKPTLNHGV